MVTIVLLRPVSLDRTKVPRKCLIGPNDVKIPIYLDRTSTDIPDNGASLERISDVEDRATLSIVQKQIFYVENRAKPQSLVVSMYQIMQQVE